MPTAKRVAKDIYCGLKKWINRELVRKVPVYVPKLQCNLLEGKTALITGGTSGIGFAVAEAFLRSGAAVVISGRSDERLEQACKRLTDCMCEGG